MSLNTVPLNVIKESDYLMDVSKLDQRTYTVYNNNEMITYQRYQAGNVNNSQISLTCIVPEKMKIDPKIYAQVTYQLTFTGTSTSGNLIQLGLYDAPRQFPFTQTTSTVSAQVNGQSITATLNQYFDAVMRYGGDYADMAKCFSTTPYMPDECSYYGQLAGTNRSPFALFGENTYINPRGGYSGIQVVSNSPTAAVINLTVYEPLFLQGFYYNKKALINIHGNMNWIFTFSNLNNLLWSHDAVNGNNITNISANITAFSLWYRFVTPSIVERVPTSAIYSYHEFVPSITLYTGTVAAGQQIQIAMSSFNLQAIPKQFYIYVRQDINLFTFSQPNAFFRIDNINLVWQNQTGLLASASTYDLYLICKSNGYQGDWDQYNAYGGAPVCLKIGKDVPLRANQSASLSMIPNMSMTITCTNISNVSIVNPSLFVEIEYEGCMTIKDDGSMSKSINVLSQQDILNAEKSTKEIHVDQSHIHSFYGSGILEDFGNLVKNVYEGAQNAIKVGEQVAPLFAGELVGGKKKRRGRAMLGGRMMGRGELDDIMAEYQE